MGLRRGFSPEDVERGRRYHRPRYLVLALDFALTVAVLAVLAFTPAGDALLPNWPWWAQALVYPAIVLIVLQLVTLPSAHWRYRRDLQWQLSTQTTSAWLVDLIKGSIVSITISTVLFLGVVSLARATDAWPVIAAPLAAAFVLFLTFIAPVVLEPIFNKFAPLEDGELADDLRALSVRAGVPVRDVLVADASRRTTKSNAYVSGFGATRRVVLYDTLLERMRPAELRAVLAHELAHRKYRDVLWFSAFFVAIAVGLVAVLWLLLGDEMGDPRVFPTVLLVLTLAQPPLFAALAALSRRWEYRADRFALRVTRDLDALETAFAGLAESNVSDLEPPKVVYYLMYTHPTVPERLAALRAAARDLGQEAA
jgi:STE24 endopeptidase